MREETDEVQAAMNTQDKAKALARLMGWGLGKRVDSAIVIASDYPSGGRQSWNMLMPYSPSVEGLAQILRMQGVIE